MKVPYAENGRKLGMALERLSAPDDLVIAVAPSVADPVAIYYSRRRGWVFPPGGGGSMWDRLRSHEVALADLDRLRRDGARWFGVAKNARDSAGRSFTEHHAELLAHLDATAERVADNPAFVIWRL